MVLTKTPAALLAYALFGASRQVVVGSTSSIAILIAAIIESIRYLGLVADLPILVGVLFVLSSLLRDGSQYPQPFVHYQSRGRDSGGWCSGGELRSWKLLWRLRYKLKRSAPGSHTSRA